LGNLNDDQTLTLEGVKFLIRQANSINGSRRL